MHFDASTSSDRDGTIVKYTWMFDDGNTTSVTTLTIDHTYTITPSPTHFVLTVTLIVTDNGGATGNTTNTMYLKTYHPPPVALFTFSPSNPRELQFVTFNATASYSRIPGDDIQGYFWDFGDGVLAGGAIYRHQYSLAGTYNVTLTVRDSFCCDYLVSSISKTIVVAPLQIEPLKVSIFFTDTRLRPLPTDVRGDPSVTVFVDNGWTIEATSPKQILIWANITNPMNAAVQSLVINETLPQEWIIPQARTSDLSGIHVYFYSKTDGRTRLVDITSGSIVKLTPSVWGEYVDVAIPSFNLTRMHHPLLPGQTILVSVREVSLLVGKNLGPWFGYPRPYNTNIVVWGWKETSFGKLVSGGPAVIYNSFNGAGFTAWAKTTNQEDNDSRMNNIEGSNLQAALLDSIRPK